MTVEAALHDHRPVAGNNDRLERGQPRRIVHDAGQLRFLADGRNRRRGFGGARSGKGERGGQGHGGHAQAKGHDREIGAAFPTSKTKTDRLTPT